MLPELPTRKTSSHIISEKSGLGIINNREAKREGEGPWRTKSGRRGGRRNWNRTNGKRGGKRFFCAHSSPFPFPTTLPLSELVAGRGRGPREGEGGEKKLSLRRSPIHQRDLLQKCQLDIGLPRESKLLDTLYFVCWQIPASPWRGRKMNYRRRSGSIPHGGGRDRKRPKPN